MGEIIGKAASETGFEADLQRDTKEKNLGTIIIRAESIDESNKEV